MVVVSAVVYVQYLEIYRGARGLRRSLRSEVTPYRGDQTSNPVIEIASYRQSVHSDKVASDRISNEVFDARHRFFLGRCFDVLPAANPG